MVLWLSQLYNGDPYTVRQQLYIEWTHYFPSSNKVYNVWWNQWYACHYLGNWCLLGSVITLLTSSQEISCLSALLMSWVCWCSVDFNQGTDPLIITWLVFIKILTIDTPYLAYKGVSLKHDLYPKFVTIMLCTMHVTIDGIITAQR